MMRFVFIHVVVTQHRSREGTKKQKRQGEAVFLRSLVPQKNRRHFRDDGLFNSINSQQELLRQFATVEFVLPLLKLLPVACNCHFGLLGPRGWNLTCEVAFGCREDLGDLLGS